jgi:hypothetical protein
MYCRLVTCVYTSEDYCKLSQKMQCMIKIISNIYKQYKLYSDRFMHNMKVLVEWHE